MTIILSIPGKPRPKPAGCIKYAHGKPYISMDKAGYNKYVADVVQTISYQYNDKVIQPYGFVYHFQVPNLLRLGDITNCMEALQDCLVKAKVIKNDTPAIVNKVSISLQITNKYLTNIYLCDKLDYIDIVERFL